VRRKWVCSVLVLLLWATVPAPAVVTTIVLEDFEASLRSYWSSYNGGSTITRTNTITPPNGGSYVLKSANTDTSLGYSTYIYFQPWESQQGDRFAYERALDVGSWVGGVNRVLEFWALPSQNYQDPVTTNGLPGYEQMSFGSFTMAASQRGAVCTTGQSANECKGNHGYHGGQFPNTGGRWMKWKMMVPGWRSTTQHYPVTRAVVATTNSVPFTLGETVNCSPSGSAHTFTNEYSHGGANTVWLLWHVYGVIVSAGDTCTGADSGAQRTWTGTPAQFDSNNFGDQNRTSAIGKWAGFHAPFFNLGGGINDEWRLDYVATPKAAYWDRVSTFYVSTAYATAGQMPNEDAYDDFVLVGDDRDDSVAVANMSICYNEVAEKLIVGWGRNQEMRGKAWEVVTAATDIHDLGFDNATPWETLADANNDYAGMQLYEPFTPPAQEFCVAVRPTDRETFAQFCYRIPDAQWGVEPDPPAASSRILRGRRVLVR